MDGLMPSEIARLVLGYLMETKCMKTTGMFLNESPHLNEYVDCLLKGKEYPATINGKTLLDILNEYATLKSKERRKDRSECAPALCTRSLLLSARNQQSFSSVSVGCGDAEVSEVRQSSSCQTSPQRSMSVEVGTQIERLPTPAKCPSLMPPSSFTFSTPTCRPVDLFSSPSVLVKSVLFGFQDSNSTPSKTDQGESTSAECRTNSPRRKGPLPRKRLYSPSANALTPSSASKRRQIEDRDATSSTSTPSSAAEDAVSTSGCVGDAVDVTALIDGMLHNSVLHERIAANINHEKAHPTVSIAEIPDETMPDMIIKNIVDRTESDPVFEAFLNVFLDKHDGSSRDSQSSQVSAVEADRGEEKAAEASPVVTTEANAEAAVSNCPAAAAVSGAGDVAYLVPVEANNGSGSVFQLVLGASAELPNSAMQFFQINHSHPKATSPPKLDTRTISPGQLFTLCGAPAAAKKQQQVEKQDNQNLIKRGITKTDDKLKRSFIRRTCAVKSLDFGQEAGGCMRQPQLVSRILKPSTAGISKPRAESAGGGRSTTTTTTVVRPRLHSLLLSAGNLEVAKSSDDVAAQTQKSTEGSPKAKTKEVSRKLARVKGQREQKSKSDGSQKTQDKLEADKVTEGGFSRNSQPDLSKIQPDLSKMNVDEFLSGIQYVD